MKNRLNKSLSRLKKEKLVKDDNKFILKASSKAIKSTEWLISQQQKENQKIA